MRTRLTPLVVAAWLLLAAPASAQDPSFTLTLTGEYGHEATSVFNEIATVGPISPGTCAFVSQIRFRAQFLDPIGFTSLGYTVTAWRTATDGSRVHAFDLREYRPPAKCCGLSPVITFPTTRAENRTYEFALTARRDGYVHRPTVSVQLSSTRLYDVTTTLETPPDGAHVRHGGEVVLRGRVTGQACIAQPDRVHVKHRAPGVDRFRCLPSHWVRGGTFTASLGRLLVPGRHEFLVEPGLPTRITGPYGRECIEEAHGSSIRIDRPRPARFAVFVDPIPHAPAGPGPVPAGNRPPLPRR
jgi:hypothetical protein